MTLPLLDPKWTPRFLELATHIAQWSKDPSTKVGAVIARPDKTIVSVGFNGFPRGVSDDARLDERAIKYEIVVHAEINAILMARESLAGYYLYTTIPPCSRCASVVVQSGIAAVFSYPPEDRWMQNCQLGRNLLEEASVRTYWVGP